MESLNNEFSVFSEVRGEGLLLGCELAPTYQGRSRDLLNLMMDEGILALVAGDNVLRMAPPLILKEQDVNDGLAGMTSAVKSFITD